jgi:hypothetical protein
MADWLIEPLRVFGIFPDLEKNLGHIKPNSRKQQQIQRKSCHTIREALKLLKAVFGYDTEEYEDENFSRKRK